MKVKVFIMPLAFLLALLVSLCFGSWIPTDAKAILYSISLIMKECLVFVLPLIIFSLVFVSITKLGTRALKYIVIIVPLICSSNFINTMTSYLCSLFLMNFGCISNISTTTGSANHLIPTFSFEIPKLLSNDIALTVGIVTGLIFSFSSRNLSENVARVLEKFTGYFFKILIPVMPFFIVGTALKLQHDGMLSVICSKYLPILLVFVVSAYVAVVLQYFLLAKFKMSRFVAFLKNIGPSVATGFGSMSSAAALPLTIKAAEANSNNKGSAGIIVPSSVNIHLVGDCFFIPMVAIGIMASFGYETPNIATYIIFAIHFVMAKFAVAAVPGGGVLVMLPILQNYLGFNADMLALITALYILFDPVITACNIAGNGALAIIFDRLTKRKSR